MRHVRTLGCSRNIVHSVWSVFHLRLMGSPAQLLVVTRDRLVRRVHFPDFVPVAFVDLPQWPVAGLARFPDVATARFAQPTAFAATPATEFGVITLSVVIPTVCAAIGTTEPVALQKTVAIP